MSTNSSDFPLTHFLIGITLSLIFLFLSLNHSLGWLTTPLTSLFSPIRYPLVQINRLTVEQLNSLKQIPHQQRIIKDLQRQNAALSVLAQTSQQEAQENEALRKIIRSPVAAPHRLIPVKVVGIARFAYLNHGSNDGLKAGLAVVTDDIFIGVIDSVTNSSARVKLLTDPDLRLDVITSLGSAGEISFSGNNLKIDQVLQKDPLQKDDRVFTRGSTLIPENLLLGTVTQVNSKQSDVYQSALVRPAAAISDSQLLFVILD